jgi:HK97 gp10 family phage protein
MMDGVSIAGLKELNTLLQELPVRMERNIMQSGIRAAGNIFRDRARANAPVENGILRKAIKNAVKTKYGITTSTIYIDRVTRYTVRVGSGANKATRSSTAFYAHFIEFGTGSFYQGKGSRSKRKPYVIPKPGRDKKRLTLPDGGVRTSVEHPGIRPQPFMRPAFDGGQNQALETFRQYIFDRLPNEIAKLKK